MRSSLRLRAAAVLALLTGCSGAQRAAPPPATAVGSPEWVVEQFYARPQFPGKRAHITGEYAEHYADAPTMGEQLPPAVHVTSRVLARSDSSAVFATSLRDSSRAADWYTYLARQEGTWRITAVRTLALPPFVYMLRDELRALPTRPDSLERRLRNLELTMRSDSALQAHFGSRRPAFDALATQFAQAGDAQLVRADGTVEPANAAAGVGAVASQLRALDLNAVRRDPGLKGCVLISIGGILDNGVGFLRADPGCQVPAMSPQEYIYLERVAPDWYLYKTT